MAAVNGASSPTPIKHGRVSKPILHVRTAIAPNLQPLPPPDTTELRFTSRSFHPLPLPFSPHPPPWPPRSSHQVPSFSPFLPNSVTSVPPPRVHRVVRPVARHVTRPHHQKLSPVDTVGPTVALQMPLIPVLPASTKRRATLIRPRGGISRAVTPTPTYRSPVAPLLHESEGRLLTPSHVA
jgi:hypothetical protein